jgi:hypothetical protein
VRGYEHVTAISVHPCFLLQTFGILKRMWRHLDMKSEEKRETKVVATFAALCLHNMIIRYRQALARTADLPTSGIEELEGGVRELEGVLAQVDMELGSEIKLYKMTEQQRREVVGDISGESGEDEDVVLGAGGSVSTAAGARGRGAKRGRGRGRGGRETAVSRKLQAVDRRTEVAADLHFRRYGSGR